MFFNKGFKHTKLYFKYTMNNSENLEDKYNFIIVDDSYEKIEKVKEDITPLGIEPVVITDEDYARRTLRTVNETYKQGKLPVIFLDRNLSFKFPEENGVMIARLILGGSFKNKGGIIFPCSYDMDLQLFEMDSYIKDKGEWYIERDLCIKSNMFNGNEIGRVCKEYLSNIDKKESEITDGEGKNFKI